MGKCLPQKHSYYYKTTTLTSSRYIVHESLRGCEVRVAVSAYYLLSPGSNLSPLISGERPPSICLPHSTFFMKVGTVSAYYLLCSIDHAHVFPGHLYSVEQSPGDAQHGPRHHSEEGGGGGGRVQGGNRNRGAPTWPETCTRLKTCHQ